MWPGKPLFALLFISLVYTSAAQPVRTTTVGEGWAANSVNAVVFRRNSLVTHGNTQYIAYYNRQQYLVLGKRQLGDTVWQVQQTPYRGNTADAHNSISIMTDGAGYLHVAWNHHNNALHYCRSTAPGSLELTGELPMTGLLENKLTYPEFYSLPDGDLLFLYRDGQSGEGNLVLNRYNVQTQRWTQLQQNLISGEKQRSAYWQAFVDSKGTIHLSWVWRETPDVASNHDLCYARSTDGGITWEKSTSEKYALPITAATAEYACTIPQRSELINQTSMFADAAGHPFIATYWSEKGSAVPQYHLVFKTGKQWQTEDLGFRKTPFSLSGTGTRHIPVSRPQIVAWKNNGHTAAALLFRDEERGSRVSVAVCSNLDHPQWKLANLTRYSVGAWEPSYDTELWNKKSLLHLFVQQVQQGNGDGAGSTALPPQPVQVLEWQPLLNNR